MSKRLSDDEKRVFSDQISLLKNENERLTDRIEELEREIIQIEKVTDAYADENAALKRGVESAHLHLLASICECGEPLKETDAFDVLDTLLKAEEQER